MPARHPPRPIRDPAAPLPSEQGQRRAGSGYVVRASELGHYSYCRHAWWLRYVAEVEPVGAGRARLDAGHERHADHGRVLFLAGLLRRIALACVLLGGFVAVFWLLAQLLRP